MHTDSRSRVHLNIGLQFKIFNTFPSNRLKLKRACTTKSIAYDDIVISKKYILSIGLNLQFSVLPQVYLLQ